MIINVGYININELKENILNLKKGKDVFLKLFKERINLYEN